jgi:CRP-like cAMP-binding protein
MTIQKFQAGDIVIKKGDLGTNLFIIMNGTIKDKNFSFSFFYFYLGTAEVYDNNQYEQQPIVSSSKLGHAQCFGALVLFFEAAHEESVRAVSSLECAIIEEKDFKEYILPMLNDLKKKSEAYHSFLRLTV